MITMQTITDIAEPATLEEIRIALGKSKQEVSKAIHISPATLTKWEHGTLYPYLNDYIDLCDYYGIDYNMTTLGFSGKGKKLFRIIDLVMLAKEQGLTCIELLNQDKLYSYFTEKAQ